VYAVVSTVDPARIGFNDITQRYAIDDTQREARYRALLESLLYTFIQPNGAMRTTQHPHIVDFKGIIGISSQLVPAPTISPLNRDYQKELEQIAGGLNTLHPGTVTLQRFESLGAFTTILTELIESTGPFKLTYAS